MKRPFHRSLRGAAMTVPVAAMMLGASQSQAVTSIGINFWGAYASGHDPYAGRVVSATAFGLAQSDWTTSYVPPVDPPPG
ncbi:MAG: hypothetical protein QM755_22695 [Luteolibacter sp.]